MAEGKGISRRIPFWLMAAVVVIGGNYALWGPDPEYHDYCWFLSLSQKPLDDIEGLLRSYKAAHGQYPSTDEGLAVLDGYALRFELTRYHPKLHWGPRKLSKKPWPANEKELRAYLGPQRNGSDEDDPNIPGLEVGICASGYLHVLYHQEPLGLQSVPYCYENLQSISSQNGGRSFIPADPQGMFSRTLDSGVRVSSLSLQSIWTGTAQMRLRKIAVELAIGVCVLIPGSWWFYCWMRDRRRGDPSAKPSARKVLRYLVILSLIFGALWCLFPWYTGGVSIPTYAGVDYCDTQADLLQAGLITQKTHDRRISATSLIDDAEATMRKSLANPIASPCRSTPTAVPRDANE